MNLETTIWRSSQRALSELQLWIEAKEFQPQHLVYILDSDEDSGSDLSLALELTETMNSSGLSFVLVSELLTYDDVPEGVGLCPTLEEAHDFIAFEDIQRDLNL